MEFLEREKEKIRSRKNVLMAVFFMVVKLSATICEGEIKEVLGHQGSFSHWSFEVIVAIN